MRISKKCEYALRALTALASHHGRDPLQIREIAEAARVPEKFLEQILLALRNAGFLQSRRGVGGGYSLIRDPATVNLAQVIRTIDGPLAPTSCVSKWAPVRCPEEKGCALRGVMLKVRNAISDILENTSLASLASPCKDKKPARPASSTPTTSHTKKIKAKGKHV